MLEKTISTIVHLNYRFRYPLAITLWILVILLIIATLGDWIPWAALGSYGYGGIFLVNVLNGAVLVFGGPSQVLTFLAAQKLSPIAVGVVGGIGSSIGELTGYYLGKSSSRLLDETLQFRIEQFRNGRVFSLLIKHTSMSLFILALIPNPLFDVASIVSGAFGIPLFQYFPPVLSGKVLRFMVIALLGKLLVQP